jgi:nucleotide-binding universal stress UspA family protein
MVARDWSKPKAAQLHEDLVLEALDAGHWPPDVIRHFPHKVVIAKLRKLEKAQRIVKGADGRWHRRPV